MAKVELVTLRSSGFSKKPISTKLLNKDKKKSPLPWLTCIKVHMESILACDFFTKDVFTPSGKITAYVLVFIHLERCRVFCSAPTYAPGSAWVTRQARNATMWCVDLGIKPRFLIRDGDTKFSKPFEDQHPAS